MVLIKPDGVKRGLIGEIIQRIEHRGLKIIALKMDWPSAKEMDKHYPKDRQWITNLGENLIKANNEFGIKVDLKKEYGTEDIYEIGKMVRGWLIDFMVSGPIVKMAVSGIHAVKMTRKLIGHTLPSFAEMGTIRGDYSVDSPVYANPAKRAIRNLIHASGSIEEAEKEIKLWFSSKEIHEYKRAEEDIMF